MTSSPAEPALVLVGPMGAGKTSIGRRVSRELGLSFADTDAMVAREHGTIPDLFREHGEEHFRMLERRAVERALAAGGVVSLGGGAVLDERTRTDLTHHRVVFLSVSARTVARRITGTSRPLLGGQTDPLAEWERIFTARRPLYEQVADVSFDTSRGPFGRIVEDVVAWARSDAGVGSPSAPVEPAAHMISGQTTEGTS